MNDVAREACEFCLIGRSAYSDARLLRETLREYLPCLIQFCCQTWFMLMTNKSLVDAEEDKSLLDMHQKMMQVFFFFASQSE
ncbi:transportin-1-like [Durio zibethinus]|uniref:Transportin-1-like n=1 Tax=Durio zibethinus TaxID=66656 RepID=A0A6P5ZS12_DURZI|nr:transportin-1-like [Durio zibethinus]